MTAAADALRAERNAIQTSWEADVLAEIPELSLLPRTMVVDHLPEFIDALAAWLDGDEQACQEGFRALADGHAIARQRAGMPIGVLMAEYSTLRRILVDAVVPRVSGQELAAQLASLNEGMDLAINEAVARYVGARDEVRERFVAILGHDLRDPLAAVQLAASVLARSQLPEQGQTLVTRIKTATARMDRLIEDVLDFTRGRLSGGIPVKPDRSDMAQICQLAVDDAKAAGTVSITLQTSGDLTGAFDRERIRQALGNLLRNARHYGGTDVEIRAWESDDHKKVFTTVTNRGPAIPPEQLATLFDPFKRPRDARARGLGLGLYIVREIARAHGAVCSARSSAEETVFTIEWPRIPYEDTPDRPT